MRYFLTFLSTVFLVGCQQAAVELPPRPPRPVTTLTLSNGVPVSSNIVSGSVKSWKTEDIGFEVAGRLQWVLEPGENIKGQLVSPDGELIQQGTPLAQIDPTRYQIAVESAQANLDVAKLSKESIEINLNDSLPAELESAKSDLKLAEIEFERMRKLKDRNAASQSEYDQARNAVENRVASITSLQATRKKSQAQLRSAEAEIKRAEQTLKDAERDLENTTLYGSYLGQISQVMVVPGSVVTAGSPVLTLQMTNPIKAEIELSAEQSRRLRRQRNLPATFALPDGSQRSDNAFVYRIDPSADPTTRTFTMTLLILNEQFRDEIPSELEGHPVAITEDVWPLRLNQMMGVPDDVILVEEKSILRDENGSYIYVVTNAKLHDTFPEFLKVRKQPIIETEMRVPFLGNWEFHSVTFADDAPPNLETLYVGQLEIEGQEPLQWAGEHVSLDSGSQWMLRPGDLVNVDLTGEKASPGFYVPLQALYQDSGTTSLFIADNVSANNGTAKKIEVQAQVPENLDAGSMIEVQSEQLTEGMQVVLGGVHYLNDGEPITIIESQTDEPALVTSSLHSPANPPESKE